MGKTGKSRRLRLLDELVGSLVGFVDADFVHFRLEDRKVKREKKFAVKSAESFFDRLHENLQVKHYHLHSV